MKRTVAFLLLAAVLLIVSPGGTFAQEVCTSNAAYVADVNVPDDTVFSPGESFEKVWRFKNSGDCTWGLGYFLAFVKGDQIGTADAQPVVSIVPAGEEVEIGVPMQAPEEMGIYTSWWQMRDAAGQFFGDKVYVRIIVPGPGGELPTGPATAVQGNKIVFAVLNVEQKPEPVYNLYAANIDGSGHQLVAEGMHQPDIRDDGTIVAKGQGTFNWRTDQEFSLRSLFTMDINGGNKKEASLYASDSRPRWSPDGRRLLIWNSDNNNIVIQEGTEIPEYVRKDPEFNLSAAYHSLPYQMFNVSGKHPIWLPDGRIVYNGCIGADCGLIIVDEAGSAPVMLINIPDAISPDAHDNKIAFMSKKDGNWEIYTINNDSSGLARLTENIANDGLPAWSPDGGQIAFLSDREGAWAVWAMNADGSNQRKLFDIGGPIRDDWPNETLAWWGRAAGVVAPPAPTPVPAPPTSTPAPVLVPPTPTLAPVPAPPTPTPETAPVLSGIEPGKGLLVVRNHIGNKEITFTIANKEHKVSPNGEINIPLDPGHYTWTASIPGVSLNGEVDITEGEIFIQSFR